MSPVVRRLWPLLLPLALVSCREPKIEVYQIPKESAPPPAPLAAPTPHPGMPGADAMAGATVATAEGPSLTWTAPASWRPKGGSTMRKGSYAVGPQDGPAGDLAITAFPGDVGGDLANLNRWRGQLQLPPIEANELARALVPLEVNGLKMLVADIDGGGDNGQKLLGAIVPFNGATWFFKLVGPAAVVAPEKDAFLAMLRTVKVAEAPAATAAAPTPPAPTAPPTPAPAPSDMASTAVRTASGPEPTWTAPAHWQSVAASAMRKATYRVTDDAGAMAELAVTAFPGDVGGELANVNRWRGQLQLPPIGEGELPAAISRLNVNGQSVAIVELTGGPADAPQRLLGAFLPVGGATWFFKFTGPPALIEREKNAFLALVKSIQTP